MCRRNVKKNNSGREPIAYLMHVWFGEQKRALLPPTVIFLNRTETLLILIDYYKLHVMKYTDCLKKKKKLSQGQRNEDTVSRLGPVFFFS